MISSSEDEVEEVISDDEQAENGVHPEENDRIDEPEVHQHEEHMDVNMENDQNENQHGSSQAQRNHDADAESEPEVENVDAKNGADADDEDDDDLLVGDLPHYPRGQSEDFSVPSSSKQTNRERAWRETIELSSSDEEEPNPFARTARRPESLSQKLNLIPDRKSQKRSPPDSFESDERSSSKKPNISSSVDSNRNLHSTRDNCHRDEAGPSEVSSGSSFMPSSRVNHSKTPANQRISDSESNEEVDQEIEEVGAILISDSEEEETEPIRESNIQSPIIIL